MSFQFLLLENIGATRIITINRPDQMNALNKATIEELHTAFADAEADENVRSEERRVGKECRARWWPDQEKEKESQREYVI